MGSGPQATNGIQVIAGVLATSALGFVFWVLAAHVMPRSAVGVASSLLALVSGLGVVGSIGAGYFLVRHLPSLGDEQWSVVVTRVAALLAAVGFAGGVAVGAGLAWSTAAYRVVLGSPAELLVFAALLALQTLSVVVDGVVLAEQRARIFLVRSIVFGLLKLAVIPAVSLTVGASPEPLVVGWAVSLSVSLLLALTWVKRVRPGAHLAWKGTFALRAAATELFQHWIIAIGAQLPTYALPAIVLARAGTSAAGSFYVGWSIGSTVFVIAASANQTLIAEASGNPDKPVGDLLRENLRFVAFLQLPAIGALFVLGPFVVRLFGHGYVGSGASVVRAVALVAVLDGCTSFGVNVARLLDRLWAAVVQSALIASVTLLAAWLLVAAVGVAGGAIGYGVGNVAAIAVFTVCILRWRREGRLSQPVAASRFRLQPAAPGPQVRPEPLR